MSVASAALPLGAPRASRAILRGGLLVRRPVVCGLLYGVAVYLFMSFVVLPLSAVYFKPAYTPPAVALGLAAHMFCVGLPIALAAPRSSTRGRGGGRP